MSDWLPSLNALRAFEATARHLSFLHAAEELNVTPSAVKQLVRRLEAALGTPLVERDGRGLRLTAAGSEGLAELAQGFGLLARGVARIRAHDGRRRLVVSAEPSFAAAWLVPRLERFRRDFPGTDVLIDTSLALADLQRGDADVAIRFGARPEEGLVAQRLFREELSAFCSPALASGPDAIRAPADLARVPLIHWDMAALGRDSATRELMAWAPWLRRLGVRLPETAAGLAFRDYNLALQAAIAGQGVVLGSRPVLQDAIAAGLLVEPFPATVATDLGYDAVATPAAMARPDVRDFLSWIAASAAAAA
ncbi:LysR substrate-binding domain-containing protein [Mangrovicoccus sp. HB161399]|uniref:LysR substrate-binding domain-containing protein n=1 Tax=Mangrovicoccus sp. HB161399 TaxID=2720392 RepID=UPI0015565C59|nr:LysR substrate-binding domain-containing protein [Mangrovicoccus sp. HB161399]